MTSFPIFCIRNRVILKVTDTIAEGTEVISVAIEPSPDYVVNAPSGFTPTVTINVLDNDGE